MGSLQRLRENWDGLASTDPLGSILSGSSRHGGWNDEEFFATGERDVSEMLEHARVLGQSIDSSSPVLDFGCGAGRLTHALAGRFTDCCGLDIAPAMIRLARARNDRPESCRYLVNDAPDLACFSNDHFGFICSLLVLQHMERTLARGYLQEFLRVLRPGGTLVCGLLDPDSLDRWTRARVRVRFRTRAKQLGRRLGLTRRPAYDMEIHGMPEHAVRAVVSAAGGYVLEVNVRGGGDKWYYVSKRKQVAM
jgi:SAM-dependent methyltransferase